jgi:hypothetical protein
MFAIEILATSIGYIFPGMKIASTNHSKGSAAKCNRGPGVLLSSKNSHSSIGAYITNSASSDAEHSKQPTPLFLLEPRGADIDIEFVGEAGDRGVISEHKSSNILESIEWQEYRNVVGQSLPRRMGPCSPFRQGSNPKETQIQLKILISSIETSSTTSKNEK